MDYSLNIYDPEIQDAMQELEIQDTDLLLHTQSFFEGSEQLQRLRYLHHTKKVQKLTKLIKKFLKTKKKEKNRFEIQSEFSQNDSNHVSTLGKAKERLKNNLSIYLDEENRKRMLMEKSIRKQVRGSKMQERRKSDVLRKQIEGKKKEEMVQKRIEDLMAEQREKSQCWNERLSRIGSRVMSFTPRIRKIPDESPSSANLLKNDKSENALQDFYDKQAKSEYLHMGVLRNKSEKSAIHNQQVKKVYEKNVSITEHQIHTKLLKVLQKCEGILTCKTKKEKINHDSSSRQIYFAKKNSARIKLHQREEFEKLNKKLEKIEIREERSKFSLFTQIAETIKMKEIKSLKTLLKNEETQENLSRLKKNLSKKREELLDKHLKSLQKFQTLKQAKEQLNLRARIEASLANQEYVRGKNLQILIQHSDSPEKASKLIQKSF